MQPQNAPQQDQNNVPPQAPPQPYLQPQAQPQPVMQPAAAAQHVGGIESHDQMQKQKPWAYAATVASFVLLVVGILVGYATFAGILLGGYGGLTGRRLNLKPLMIWGYVGMGLNAALLLFAYTYRG